MNHSKYTSGSPLGFLISFLLVFMFVGISDVGSFSFSSIETPLNCSTPCKCDSQNIQYVLNQHLRRHRNFMGTEYRQDVDYATTYIDFIGIYVLMVNQIVDMRCLVDDKRQHALSTLLNGVDYLRYVSLTVICLHGEELLWDVPTWQVSVNIFVGKKCKIVPVDEVKGIVIPMNMWIFEADNCGANLLTQINIRFTMNTIALLAYGTESDEIPESWSGDYMLSATNINLQSNRLREYNCQLTFTKDIDTINLGKNRFTDFPSCMLYDQRILIRYLSLSHNNISNIATLFEDQAVTSTIQIIDLSHNLINKIGTFKALPGLTVLDLSRNLITEINDDAFQNLIDLKQLHLQNNRIHYIGSVAFRNNVNLISINLNSNALKFVRQEQFPTTDSDLRLDVRRNKLNFPPFVGSADSKHGSVRTAIKVLSAANPYHCNCDMIRMEEYINRLNTNHMNTSNTSEVYMNTSNASEVYGDVYQMKCASPAETKGKLLSDLSFIRSCIIEINCPQSCSCHLENKSSIAVNCTARRLLELPDVIPSYGHTSSRLYLSHNPLQLLSYRSYLANLSELHMDNCLLTSVTPAGIAALQNVKVLALHNNLIQRLPSLTKNITLKKASNVTLHNNRWACSCDSLWLPQWITRHREILWTPGNIICNYLQKPVEEFSKSDVSCTAYTHAEVVLAMALALVSIASTAFMLFHYSEELSLLIYTRLGMRLSLNFSYGDHFNPYDVYVSYGEDNYKWVVDTLVPRLEDGPKKYKLCLHYRDFPTDMSVIENIPWAIKLSRCSLLVLSKAFMKKEWRLLDLRTIFQRLLLVANRLVIIVTDDLTPDDVSSDLRAYMNTHEYLQVDDPRFWEKIEMFLPSKNAAEEDVGQAFEQSCYGAGDSMVKGGDSNNIMTADSSFIMGKSEQEPSFLPTQKMEYPQN